MSLVLPKLALIEQPVIETFGCPEFYIDGTVQIVEQDVTHIVCFVSRTTGDRTDRFEVVRCHMGRGNYERNLIGAFERMTRQVRH